MFTVELHATSHIGRVRKANQDNFLLLDVSGSKTWMSAQESGEFIIESQKFEIDENGIILAVSDGMGKASAGEVASRMAVEIVSERFFDDDTYVGFLRDDLSRRSIGKLYSAVFEANYLMRKKESYDPQFTGMFATFTGIGITREGVDCVHVGDNRVYLIRNDNIYQLTKDQSLVQKLTDLGRISQEEAETHPLKNVILQALGTQSDIFPTVTRLVPQHNDLLLLCTDGLSNNVSSIDFLRIVSENKDRLEMACAYLIKEANERGGEDNITVIVAKLTGDELSEQIDDEVKLELLDFGNTVDTTG